MDQLEKNQKNVVEAKCRTHFQKETSFLDYQLLVVESTLADFLWQVRMSYVYTNSTEGC